MKMTAHQTVSVHLPASLLAYRFKCFQEPFPVQIVAKDFLAPITSVHQVINGSFVLDMQLPRHASVRAKSGNCVNIEDYPPLPLLEHCASESSFRVLHGLRVAESMDRIISIISLSLCRPDPVTSSTTPSQYASSGVSW
jgi:hypothetical protein